MLIAGADANSPYICLKERCMWWCGFADDCAVSLLASMFADSSICRNAFETNNTEDING